MALIVCTECGKEFSDKAACCPGCGCPTEVVLENLHPEEIVAQKEHTSAQATKFMMDEVKKAWDEVREANRLFYESERELSRMSSDRIDVLSLNAAGRVRELATMAQEATTTLYNTLQTIVQTVDSLLRPMLALDPSGEAIKEVRDLIRSLNKDSDIERNFAASLNGEDLGSIGNTRYMPGVKSKAIERFWDAQFELSPYGKEYEEKRKQEAEEERKRQKEERERQKQERERQKQEDIARKEHYEQVCAECRQKVDSYKVALDEELIKQEKSLSTEIDSLVEELMQRKSQLEQDVISLGMFQIKEKKEKKQEMEIISGKINQLTNSNVVAEEVERLKKSKESAVQQYSELVEGYLNKRFPNVDTFQKRDEKYHEEEVFSATPCPEAPVPALAFTQ